jgi:hypothetical protein
VPDHPSRQAPARGAKKAPLSRLTRYGVVPLLLLAIGVRIGMLIERSRLAESRAAIPQALVAPSAPAAADRSTQEPAPAPTLEMTGSFENNIFPSLLLSFGASYPEYSRGLTVSLRNLPASGTLQLRIDSGLF